jgi:hypothetical protein
MTQQAPLRSLQETPPPPQLALDFAPGDPAEFTPTPWPRRIAWAQLLARVFAIDITRCRTCGGRMRVLEVVSDADAIARSGGCSELLSLGLTPPGAGLGRVGAVQRADQGGPPVGRQVLDLRRRA